LVVVFRPATAMSAELVYSDLENREKPLSEAEAKIRKRQIEGNPSYSYHCVLQKNSEEYKGQITIRFKYNKVENVDGTFVDFFGKKISHLEANGQNLLAAADTSSLWTASRLHFKDAVLKNGQENEVVIHFVNDYDHTGAGSLFRSFFLSMLRSRRSCIFTIHSYFRCLHT
jgi:translation elongation factor EF-1alpha